MLRHHFVLFLLAGLPLPALAQGPVFLASPNTAPASDVVPTFSYVRQGEETDLNFQAAYGVRSPFMLGVGAMMVMVGSGPLELGRLQAQTKVRLLQKTGEGKRTVLGLSAGVGLPVGESVSRVARANGVSNVVTSLTASHVERRMGFFAGAQYTLDVYDAGNRSTGTLGGAASWRFKPAPPGVTGGPGFTLFGEALSHYEANHSGWIALAPGIMFRTGQTQIKVGLRAPIKRWNTTSAPEVTVGTSMFIPVKSTRP